MGGPPPAPLVAPAAPPIWTGFYIGVNGGGAWDTTGGHNTNCGTACTSAETTITGPLGGGQAGYNYQFGALVVGAEVDFSGSSLHGSYPAADGVDTLTSSVNFIGTATGKLGATIGGLLIYGKGGAAWTHTSHGDYNAPEAATFSTDFWQMGWTAGAGIEYALTPNWSIKVEYDAIGTPDKSTTFNSSSGLFFTASMNQFINAVIAGINYRF
jgi:outer membrane autotransporter protein